MCVMYGRMLQEFRAQKLMYNFSFFPLIFYSLCIRAYRELLGCIVCEPKVSKVTCVCLFCCCVTTDTCRLSCARRKVSPLVTLFFSPLFRHFYNGKLTLHMLYFCVMNNVLRILCVAEELKI